MNKILFSGMLFFVLAGNNLFAADVSSQQQQAEKDRQINAIFNLWQSLVMAEQCHWYTNDVLSIIGRMQKQENEDKLLKYTSLDINSIEIERKKVILAVESKCEIDNLKSTKKSINLFAENFEKSFYMSLVFYRDNYSGSRYSSDKFPQNEYVYQLGKKIIEQLDLNNPVDVESKKQADYIAGGIKQVNPAFVGEIMYAKYRVDQLEQQRFKGFSDSDSVYDYLSGVWQAVSENKLPAHEFNICKTPRSARRLQDDDRELVPHRFVDENGYFFGELSFFKGASNSNKVTIMGFGIRSISKIEAINEIESDGAKLKLINSYGSERNITITPLNKISMMVNGVKAFPYHLVKCQLPSEK